MPGHDWDPAHGGRAKTLGDNQNSETNPNPQAAPACAAHAEENCRALTKRNRQPNDLRYDARMVDLEHLATYVPRRVLRNFAATGAGDLVPRVEHFPAAIVFADISGFTDLCERLGRKGAAGTEELSTIINGCFG